MANNQDELSAQAASLTNGSQSDVAHTNGEHPGSKKLDSILQVKGSGIVDGHGEAVVLKRFSLCFPPMLIMPTGSQAGLGGHMNMENFITGFTGHEHEYRAAMLHVLGSEKIASFNNVRRLAPDVSRHY